MIAEETDRLSEAGRAALNALIRRYTGKRVTVHDHGCNQWGGVTVHCGRATMIPGQGLMMGGPTVWVWLTAEHFADAPHTDANAVDTRETILAKVDARIKKAASPDDALDMWRVKP